MAEDSDLEKTEEPSQSRLEKARSEGQVLSSRDVVSFIILSIGFSIIWISSYYWVSWYASLVKYIFIPYNFNTPIHDWWQSDWVVYATFVGFGWFFLLLIILFLMHIGLNGGNLFYPYKMRWSRINPIVGFGQLFSKYMLTQTFAFFVKTLLIIGSSIWLAWLLFKGIGWGDSFELMLKESSEVFLKEWLWLMLIVVLVAIIDFAIQWFNYFGKLKMSVQEVKDEHKEQDGNPEIKQYIRRMQQQVARRRMMQQIPLADVVVVNPTRFAVALKYNAGKDKAPRVVAKGHLNLAAKIKEKAEDNNIPIITVPPLARYLYKNVEIDQQIPEKVFEVIALILIFIRKLDRNNKNMLLWESVPDNIKKSLEINGIDAGI